VNPRRDPWVHPTLIVAALTAIGAGIRLVVLHDSLFADELSTYWIVADRSLGGVVSVVHTDAEITPPLYFVLAWLATRIDVSAEMLRLPSLVAGVAAIPLVYLLGQRTVGRGAGMVAAAITALSPFMIYYSTEARGYELMIFLVLCPTLALLAAIETGRVRWWGLYAVASCGAAYSHYTAIFALAAQLIWVLWVHPEMRKPALLANVAAVVGFLPWLTGLIADLQSPTTDILSALLPFTGDFVLTSVSRWSLGYPNNTVSLSSMPGVPALALITAGVAIAIAAWLVAHRSRSAYRGGLDPRLVLVVGLALAAPLGEAVVSALGSNVLGTRNLAPSWPALALLIATVVVSPPRPIRPLAAGLVVAGFAIAGLKMTQSDFQRPQTREATELAAREATPRDVLLDATRLSPGPLTAVDLALDRRLRIVRLDLPQQRERPFALLEPILSRREATRLAVKEARGHRIFLITPTEGDPYQPNALGSEAVRNLPPSYRLVQAHSFPGFVPMATLVFARKESSGPSPGSTSG
jgi:mannosyltransferase